MQSVTTQQSSPIRDFGPPVQRRSVRPLRKGWASALGMICLALILLPILVVGGATYHVWSLAKVHNTTKTDAIVVLGAAQFNGTPSPVLEERLQHALSLYKSGVAPHIVTVGGKQHGDRFTEAQAGRAWLTAKGIPSTAVTAVDAGTDTETSLRDVADVAKKRGWESITLTSDPAHMARSEAIAHRLGFKVATNPTNAGDGSTVTTTYLAREAVGYLYFETLLQWDVPRVLNR